MPPTDHPTRQPVSLDAQPGRRRLGVGPTRMAMDGRNVSFGRTWQRHRLEFWPRWPQGQSSSESPAR